MPLTDVALRSARPRDKTHKLFDGGGLDRSQPGWRQVVAMEVEVWGQGEAFVAGGLPQVSLKAAGERREASRKQLAAGIDPGEARKAEKLSRAGAESFEAVAREWHAKFSPGWVASHGDRILRRLEKDVFPWLGKRPVAEIKAPELLAVLRRIESRGALETAHQRMQNSGQVFRYAVATGRAERDPTGDLRGRPPPVQRHDASIVEPKQIGALLRAIDSYEGFFVTKCALKLAPLVFVRPGELRQAQWPEIDLEKCEWRIPAERMKMREQHIVPLSRQAIDILRELIALTGEGIPAKPTVPRFLFPGARTRSDP